MIVGYYSSEQPLDLTFTFVSIESPSSELLLDVDEVSVQKLRQNCKYGAPDESSAVNVQNTSIRGY